MQWTVSVPIGSFCQVWVYSGKRSGQVWTEMDEGEGHRLDKELVQPELRPIGFNNKGIKR